MTKPEFLQQLLQVVDEFHGYGLRAEDVRRAKPDPACYNDLIARLGIPRENCLIFEDSASGVAAALASGCQTLVVKEGV